QTSPFSVTVPSSNHSATYAPNATYATYAIPDRATRSQSPLATLQPPSTPVTLSTNNYSRRAPTQVLVSAPAATPGTSIPNPTPRTPMMHNNGINYSTAS